MSHCLLYEVQPPAAVLTLHRPERRNALGRELLAALHEGVRRAGDDPAVRCVILTGSPPAFCAGMDLVELDEQLRRHSEGEPPWDEPLALASLLDLLYQLPKPTVAAVNGAAVAGGAALVSVCDLALAVPEARLGYPEVRRGLVAALVIPHLLRHVGEHQARRLLLTGELVSADEAVRVGLVNEVVPAAELLPRAHAWASAVAEGGPEAVAQTRALLNRFSAQAAAVRQSGLPALAPRLSEEGRAGLAAFRAGRRPPWAPNR